MPLQGLQEAARAVATGDVVTRSQSRFWQGHDGACLCGGGKETVKHFLWIHLGGQEQCWSGAGKRGPLTAISAQAGDPRVGPQAKGLARKLEQLHAQLRGLEGEKNLDGRVQFLPSGWSAQSRGLGFCRLAGWGLGLHQRHHATRHRGGTRRGPGHPSCFG